MKLEEEARLSMAEPDDPNLFAQLIRLADWGPRDIEWLWEPLIPRGKVTLLVGEQEIGKSFFSLDLAARLSRGESIPPAGPLADGPGNTLILTGDDDLDDTVYPRLRLLDADLARIYALTMHGPKLLLERRPQFSLARGVERLHTAAKMIGDCRLIVIDPVTAFLEGLPNSHAAVRQMLHDLQTVAKRHSASVLLVTHYCKESTAWTLHRTLGSLAFTIAARVVLALVHDPAVAGVQTTSSDAARPSHGGEGVGPVAASRSNSVGLRPHRSTDGFGEPSYIAASGGLKPADGVSAEGRQQPGDDIKRGCGRRTEAAARTTAGGFASLRPQPPCQVASAC